MQGTFIEGFDFLPVKSRKLPPFFLKFPSYCFVKMVDRPTPPPPHPPYPLPRLADVFKMRGLSKRPIKIFLMVLVHFF